MLLVNSLLPTALSQITRLSGSLEVLSQYSIQITKIIQFQIARFTIILAHSTPVERSTRINQTFSCLKVTLFRIPRWLEVQLDSFLFNWCQVFPNHTTLTAIITSTTMHPSMEKTSGFSQLKSSIPTVPTMHWRTQSSYRISRVEGRCNISHWLFSTTRVTRLISQTSTLRKLILP